MPSIYSTEKEQKLEKFWRQRESPLIIDQVFQNS